MEKLGWWEALSNEERSHWEKLSDKYQTPPELREEEIIPDTLPDIDLTHEEK